MTRYLFSSHDGYGLGHVRRNCVLAAAVADRDPGAEIVVVTGARARPSWLRDPRVRVVSVPALTKDAAGRYVAAPGALPSGSGPAAGARGLDAVLAARAETFERLVRTWRPDVVVVDRHPLGAAGELRGGLLAAAARGSRLVLGLRDVLDEAATVRRELAGPAWRLAASLFDDVLVYGDPALCDHQQEYGLTVEPTYVGWVVGRTGTVPGSGHATGRASSLGDATTGPTRDPATVVVAAGGACLPLFQTAGAVVQMAGYNCTVEALVAGLRPILVPRQVPRREQTIRAARLAALGLADVVDDAADPAELQWLLDRSRLLPPDALRDAGLRTDGAARTAALLVPARAVAA